MSIFSKRTLTVTPQEVKEEYSKFSNKELTKEVMLKFNRSTRLHSNVKYMYLSLLTEVPFTRKQSLMFLEKFNNVNQIMAYYYRHLVRCAHFYGVPRVIIENYLKEKDLYNAYHDGTYTKSTAKSEHKRKLRDNADTLLTATLEMIRRSKTRKGKLEKITEKIADKNI